jgi:hypothetical protein
MRDDGEMETGIGTRFQATCAAATTAVLVSGLVHLMVVLTIRYLAAGQISLSGVDTYGPAIHGVRYVEVFGAPGVALVVALVVAGRAWGDFSSTGPADWTEFDWVWSFWIPILVGGGVFTMLYSVVLENAVVGAALP